MELGLENMMSDVELDNLFSEDSDTNTQETEQVTPPESGDKNKEETTTEEINPEEIFEVESTESVGSEEKETKEKEDTTSQTSDGTSPKTTNFYSSIANALKEDGVLPDLDDTDKIVDAEGFAKAIENQINQKLDEKQRRIDEALSNGVNDNVVRQYENTIAYLDSLSEDKISEEGEAGETLRRQLIYQDLVNRGYTKDQAVRKCQKSFDSGNDIEDAKDALEGNKDFFNKSYKKLLDDAKAEAEAEETERKQRAETITNDILKADKVFGSVTIDKTTKQKIVDTINKPVYRDKDTGELYTALQKFESENKNEFLKAVGTLFVLTDGFKNIDKLVKSGVEKGVKKGIKELEHTLNNTSRTSGGNLQFVSGVSDPESFIEGKWDLDI